MVVSKPIIFQTTSNSDNWNKIIEFENQNSNYEGYTNCTQITFGEVCAK